MSSERPRVLLLGLGPTAEGALASLLPHFEVVGVVRDAQPPDPVALLAAQAGVPVRRDISPAAVAALVRDEHPDALVCSSYDRVLPADLVSQLPCVNVHYACLPRRRGRANVVWAMLQGDPTTAVSVHVLAPGLDAGGILARREVTIGPRDTVADVYARLDAAQREVLPGAVARHLAGDAGEPQEESGATYGCARVPDDGELDWRLPTLDLDRAVRALGPPFPGAFTYLGLRRLRVVRAEPSGGDRVWDGRIPGRVVSVRRDGGVDVLTGDGVLRLLELAESDGPVVPAAQLVRSTRATLGLRVPDLVRRLEELSAEVATLRAAANGRVRA